MAWKDTLLQARFRGVPFEVLDVTRAGQRDVALHRVPYTNGSQNEDMGLAPRGVRLRAIFYGDDYENQLHALIQALETPGAGELIHPIHGSMTVTALRWDDDHEAELVDGAVVRMEFLEDRVRDPVFSEYSASAKTDAIATKAEDARAAADDSLARRVSQVPSFDIPRITVLKDVFDQAKGALSRLMSFTNPIKALLSDLDPLVYPKAYAADLRAVVDVALQGLPFGGLNDLFSSDSGAQVVAGTALADFALARGQLDPSTISLAPAAALPAADMVADALVVQAHAQVHASTALAECAGIVLSGELEQPALDRADIEAVCNQARAALQVAITAARASLDAEGRAQTSIALRDLAWQLQEAARAVINQRPPLVSKPSPIGGPVRLVAHALYGDAARATEITRLNRLGRKVYIDMGEAMNVYSQ